MTKPTKTGIGQLVRYVCYRPYPSNRNGRRMIDLDRHNQYGVLDLEWMYGEITDGNYRISRSIANEVMDRIRQDRIKRIYSLVDFNKIKIQDLKEFIAAT